MPLIVAPNKKRYLIKKGQPVFILALTNEIDLFFIIFPLGLPKTHEDVCMTYVQTFGCTVL